MAGDWIPMQVDLNTRREVLLLCKATGWSQFEVIGRLWHFWSWVSRESADGQLRGVDTVVLSAVLGVPEKFLTGLVEVGWLVVASDGLIVPNYGRWFSGAAKIRLGERVRWQERRSPAARGDPQQDSGGNSGGNSGGTPELHKRREHNKKDKKPSCRKLRFDEADRAIAQWMFGLIRKLNPDHKPPNLDAWANTVRLMREQDQRAPEDIRAVFAWANADPFWQVNILSAEKLRSQFDQLAVKRHRPSGSSREPEEAPNVNYDFDAYLESQKPKARASA